jgi:hypothetical protein
MKIQHVSIFPKNDFTLGRMEEKEWKDGRVRTQSSILPLFHPQRVSRGF